MNLAFAAIDTTTERKGLRSLRRRVLNRVTLLLGGQKGIESSSRFMDGIAKFVSPKGLRHAVKGGTNCACLASRACSHSLPGVSWPAPFPDGRCKTCEEFDLIARVQALEEGVPLLSNFLEELAPKIPDAAALGAGTDGNCCVLRSSRS